MGQNGDILEKRSDLWRLRNTFYLCLMESRRSYNGPRRPSEKTFVYGIHPVTEALDSGKNLDRIVVSRDGKNERLNKLVGQARAAGVPIKMVPKVKLDSITLKNHQGIIAFLSPKHQPIEEIVMGAYERVKLLCF